MIKENTIDITNEFKYTIMRRSKSGAIHVSYSNSYFKLLVRKIFKY